MTREASQDQRELSAKHGSEALLERMEAVFLSFSYRNKVDYLDARELLMNYCDVKPGVA